MSKGNKAMSEAVAKVLRGSSPAAAPKKKARLELCEMIIRKGFAGGFIVKHRLEPANKEYGGYKEHEYPLASLTQLQKHLNEHLGDIVAEPEPEGADEAE